jgi:hypothetical protein
MPKRNYGFPESDGQRYPNGCDWHKPSGCTCRFYAQAQSCENRCDLYEAERKSSGFARWIVNVSVSLFVLLIVLAIVSKARGADLVAPPSVPFYCKPLLKFERSCVGVKAAALTFGKSRARALALRCGATQEEIQYAESCFEK